MVNKKEGKFQKYEEIVLSDQLNQDHFDQAHLLEYKKVLTDLEREENKKRNVRYQNLVQRVILPERDQNVPDLTEFIKQVLSDGSRESQQI